MKQLKYLCSLHLHPKAWGGGVPGVHGINHLRRRTGLSEISPVGHGQHMLMQTGLLRPSGADQQLNPQLCQDKRCMDPGVPFLPWSPQGDVFPSIISLVE